MQEVTKSGIYCIENTVSSKKYIGQSVNVNNRWRQHRNELNKNCHFNDYLQKSWNKHGESCFRFYVLEYCNEEDLDEREIYYIELYNTLNRDYGYNLKTGGQSNPSLSEESRKKLSESIQKSYLDPNRRKIQRDNALKQWTNPEIKAKISGPNSAMYGKHHTNEAKEKISQANKGRRSYRRNTTPVFCIELNKEFEDATEAGKELGIDSSAILKVCRGERKICGGYRWQFKTIGE